MFQSTSRPTCYSFSFQLGRQYRWIRVRLHQLPFPQLLTRPKGSVVSVWDSWRCGCVFDTRLRKKNTNFLSGVFSPLTSAEACDKIAHVSIYGWQHEKSTLGHFRKVSPRISLPVRAGWSETALYDYIRFCAKEGFAQNRSNTQNRKVSFRFVCEDREGWSETTVYANVRMSLSACCMSLHGNLY